MADPIVFRSDDRETVVEIGDQVYLPSSLHSAIINYLLSDTFRTNGYLQSRKVYADIRMLVDGIESRVLQPRKSWISGKISVKVYLEFVPDDPYRDSGDSAPRKLEDSILDDLRAVQVVSMS